MTEEKLTLPAADYDRIVADSIEEILGQAAEFHESMTLEEATRQAHYVVSAFYVRATRHVRQRTEGR